MTLNHTEWNPQPHCTENSKLVHLCLFLPI